MTKQNPRSRHPVRAMPLEQQWEFVAQARSVLEASAIAMTLQREPKGVHDIGDTELGVPNQALANLEHAWRSLDRARYFPLLANRDALRQIAESPLEAMLCYVQLGMLPPPELLVGLTAATRRYFDAAGSVSMEEALFGKVKPKAGNRAARSAASFQESSWAMRIAVTSKDLGGDVPAAERIVEEEGLDIDPESLLRRARKRWTRAEK